jgi:AcrR family transcriptional regulator
MYILSNVEPVIFDKKLEIILNTARKLFFERGFRKISIDEFCSAAGVSKMTFYKHFNNKDELVVKLFSEIIEQSILRFEEIVNSDKSFPEKIEAMITMKLEQTSLFSKAFLEDIFQSGSEIQKMLSAKQKESKNLFKKFYTLGVKEGFASPDIDPEFFIAASENIIQWGNTPPVISLYPDPHERTRHLTNFFFYGIMGNHRRMETKETRHD